MDTDHASEHGRRILSGEQILNGLAQTERFRELFMRFSGMTGYPLWLVRLSDREILLRAGEEDGFSRLSTLSGGQMISTLATTPSPDTAAQSDGPQLLRYRSGFVEGVVPVVYDSVRIADICVGQVFLSGESRQDFKEFCKEFELAEAAGVDILASIPVASGQGFREALHCLSALSGLVLELLSVSAEERESEEKYRLLTEQASDIIWICSFDGTELVYHYLSPACYRVLGFTPEEMKRIPIREQVPPESMEEIKRVAASFLSTGEEQVFYLRHRHKNGGFVECEVLAGRLACGDPDAPVFQGRATDVTERKKYERELCESERRFSLFMDYLPASVFIKDTESRYLYTNKYFRDAFQLESFVGKTACDLFEEEIAGQMIAEDQLVLRGETVVDEKTVPHADGSIHTSQSYEFLIEGKGGEPLIGGISIDTTELKAMEARLRQSEKMESIGTLAGGVAHDFNNLLTGIITAADLIEKRLTGKDPEMSQFLGHILRASHQAANLTRKLLAFSRKGVVRFEAVDLHAAIQDSLALLQRSIDKNIRFETTLGAEDAVVRGDRTQLQNAIMNLGINAAHAMAGGGTIFIRTSRVVLDAAYCSASTFEIVPGGYVVLEFEDTGHGIPEEEVSRIFEPFYTTKEMGTGLGLPTVYGTILDHGAEIQVVSDRGRGTRFNILLPAIREEAVKTEATGEPVSGSGVILLVDDEEMIREPGRAMLEGLGYTVRVAATGAAAVEIFRKEHSNIALVLLDMVMPGMGGKEVFRALREIDPGCRVVISSGYSHGDDLDQIFKEGADGFIQKPYDYAGLSRKVRDALKGPMA